MRKLFTVFIVSIIALVGMAGAYTDVGDIIKGKDKFGALWLPDYGTAPSQGWISLGTDKNFYMYYDETTNDRVDLVMTAGGMYFDVTDITFYSDDSTNDTFSVSATAAFTGPFGVTGETTLGGDITVSAGKDLDCAAGASEFDFSLGTGVFKTTTGLHTFGGGLAANWDAGSYKITSSQFESDITTGTAPFVVASTTAVSNLNSDKVDGKDSTDLVLRDGTQALTAAWDAGSYGITAETFTSDVTTGTAPFTVASTTAVSNLNADKLDGKDATDVVLRDGTQELTANWDVGSYKVTAGSLESDASVNATTSVNAADGEFSDDVNVTDDLAVTGLATIGETFGVTGASTFEGNVLINTTMSRGFTETDIDVVIGDTDVDMYLVGNATENQTVTLPTAADNSGRILTIVIATAPGDKDLIVDGEDSETINDAATLTNTDNVGDSIQIMCDGDEWFTVAMHGTWS